MSSAFYAPEGHFLKIGCKSELQNAVEKTAYQHNAECWYCWNDGGYTTAYANTIAELVAWLRLMKKESRLLQKEFKPHIQYRKYWRGTDEPLTQAEYDTWCESHTPGERWDLWYDAQMESGQESSNEPSLEEIQRVLEPTLIEKIDVTDRFGF